MELEEKVHQLKVASYNLALKCVDTSGDRSFFPPEAMVLMTQLNELAEEAKGKESSDTKRMLGNINLELTFVSNLGTGPTSNEVSDYMIKTGL
jgi:hypothetical protein